MKIRFTTILLLTILNLAWIKPQAQTTPNYVLTFTPSNPCVGTLISFTINDLNGIANLSSTPVFWFISDGSTGSSQGGPFQRVFNYPGIFTVCGNFVDPVTQMQDSVCTQVNISQFCGPHDLYEGTVYLDANNNGVRDVGESGYFGSLIQVNSGGPAYSTTSNGFFSVAVSAGPNTISCNPPSYYSVTQPVGNSYAVTSTASGLTNSNFDFGLYPAPGIQDLRVNLASSPHVPGFNRIVTVNVINMGTQIQSGTVSVTLDPNVTFVNSGGVGTFSAGVFTAPFSNIAPANFFNCSFTVNASTSLQIGNSVTYSAIVNPLVGDANLVDNYDTITYPVVGSYDPNDKTARGTGLGPNGEMNAGDVLRYTIRFQNEGNFPATFIYVRDTLDPDLDFGTFRVLGSSHAMTHTLVGDKIEFYFNNIQLVPKSQDEAASQGFVTYSIQSKNSLAPGDSVTNTASIYFDYNPPVVTNTTVNTVWVPTGIENATLSMEIELFPNPMAERATLQFDAGGESWDLKVTDLQGRTVMVREDVRNGEIQIQRGELAGGTYLFQLVSESGKMGSGKMVVR